MPEQEFELITHTVTALQLHSNTVQEFIDFCGGVEVEEIDCHDSTKRFKGVNVPTLEGVKRASIRPSGGDWVLKRNGSYTVMPHWQFSRDYRPI